MIKPQFESTVRYMDWNVVQFVNHYYRPDVIEIITQR
jgi:hypothetical protein